MVTASVEMLPLIPEPLGDFKYLPADNADDGQTAVGKHAADRPKASSAPALFHQNVKMPAMSFNAECPSEGTLPDTAESPVQDRRIVKTRAAVSTIVINGPTALAPMKEMMRCRSGMFTSTGSVFASCRLVEAAVKAAKTKLSKSAMNSVAIVSTIADSGSVRATRYAPALAMSIASNIRGRIMHSRQKTCQRTVSRSNDQFWE